MKFRLTNTATEDTIGFEAANASMLRSRLNPLLYAAREELDEDFRRCARFEIQVWDDRREHWVGPHLPRSNEDRWVQPIKSGAEASWLWKRLLLSLNLEDAKLWDDFRATYNGDWSKHLREL